MTAVMDYKSLTDEELAQMAYADSLSAFLELFERYKGNIKIWCQGYYSCDIDYDFMMQQGLVGLYVAIRDYKQLESGLFRNFANMCIRRQVMAAANHIQHPK